MDPIKILKRAWNIVWNYRTLWVFAFLLALTAGGSSGLRSNSNYRTDRQEWQGGQQTIPEDFEQALEQAAQEMETIFQEGLPSAGISQPEITALLWTIAILVLVSLVMGIGMAVVRYVTETAVIKMVDGYERAGEKVGVKAGFRLGWNRASWRLFLINLIISLPLLLVVLGVMVGGLVVFVNFARGNQDFAIASSVGLIGLAILLFVAVAILSIALNLLKYFFWRAAVLEDLGVGASFRQGWEVVRSHFRDVGLMWLVMLGLGVAWIIASTIAAVLVIPLILVTGIAAVLVAGIPYLLIAGIASMVFESWLMWVVPALFVLPLFSIIAFSPWIAIGGMEKIFTSTVWTLVYRELTTPPAPVVEEAPPLIEM